MNNKNRKIFWILSLVIVVSMLCSLFVSVIPRYEKSVPTPTPALLYPTARP